MDSSTFIAEFAQIANAPNGVQRLREMILDLAVRGKLVPQDPNDEPAEKLLERIKAEKEQLVKEKKIPKFGNNRTSSFPKAIDFDLPKSWIWTTLEDICTYIQRGRSPKYTEKSSIPIVSQKCVQWNGFSLSKARFLDLSILDKYEPKRFLKRGDLLWNSTGLGTVGRCILFEEQTEYPKVVADSHVTIVRPHLVNSGYLFSFIASNHIQSIIEDITTGTTKQSELGTGIVRLCPFPLPPLAEQKHIVAKVDELMALCDRLEQSQQARENTRSALCTSALHQLMNAESDTDLQSAWSMVSTHFTTLANHPSAVKGLRETILQLAVRGKLVPQDPNDEPAEKLLERIKAEKERLIKEKKIRKEKPLPPITDKDKPFEVPEGWVWCRLRKLCTYIVDCLHRTPKYSTEGYPAIRTCDIKPGILLIEKARKVPQEEYLKQTRRLIPQSGDIFYSREGSFGIAAVVPPNIQICLSQRMMQFRLGDRLFPDYFSWCMNSPALYQQAQKDALGSTVPHINMSSLKAFAFPLPPLAEQKRIVAKVDELMALCDRLEAQLTQRHQTATLLAQSATKSVVEDLSILEGRSKEEEPILPMVEHKADDSGQLQLF